MRPLHLLLILFCSSACTSGPKASSEKPPAPANVERVVKESEIGHIVLTEDAERRIDVATEPVTKKRLERVRIFGAEVLAPPGATVEVTAPQTGLLAPPSNGPAFAPGDAIREGDTVFTLKPTASERARLGESGVSIAGTTAEADAEIDRAKVELDASKTHLDRMVRLFEGGVGNQKDVDDAKSRHDLAEANLKSARKRRAAIAGVGVDGSGAASSTIVSAPMTGQILRMRAVAGQVVVAGAPLFDIVREATLWVRASVYAGDVPRLRTNGPARAGELGGASDWRTMTTTATPISAPPSASATASSIDLFFELDPEASRRFRIGQKVRLAIPLLEEDEAPTVPSSAIVHDYNGRAWVYEALGSHTYVRRQVEIRYVSGNEVALERGPVQGTSVVTRGAAELFGTELGVGR